MSGIDIGHFSTIKFLLRDQLFLHSTNDILALDCKTQLVKAAGAKKASHVLASIAIVSLKHLTYKNNSLIGHAVSFI